MVFVLNQVKALVMAQRSLQIVVIFKFQVTGKFLLEFSITSLCSCVLHSCQRLDNQSVNFTLPRFFLIPAILNFNLEDFMGLHPFQTWELVVHQTFWLKM